MGEVFFLFQKLNFQFLFLLNKLKNFFIGKKSIKPALPDAYNVNISASKTTRLTFCHFRMAYIIYLLTIINIQSPLNDYEGLNWWTIADLECELKFKEFEFHKLYTIS